MLGLGFLFAALVALGKYPSEGPSRLRSAHPAAAIGVAFLLVLSLGIANAAVSRHVVSRNPDVIAAARAEVESLKEDFVTAPISSKCGLHKRLYTFKEQYDQDYLLEGAFSGLQAQGLPEARADYFLDPWNSPYWLRSQCSKDRSRIAIFVYSFGPNRRRDSDRWKIVDDDIGAYIARLPSQ